MKRSFFAIFAQKEKPFGRIKSLHFDTIKSGISIIIVVAIYVVRHFSPNNNNYYYTAICIRHSTGWRFFLWTADAILIITLASHHENIWLSSKTVIIQNLWFECELYSLSTSGTEKWFMLHTKHFIPKAPGQLRKENFNKVMHSTLKILLLNFAPTSGSERDLAVAR